MHTKLPNPITTTDHSFTDEELDHGVRFSFQPGNGSNIELMMLKGRTGAITCVAGWNGCGSGAYDFSGWADTSYVAEKLKMLPGDASCVARLINTQNQI